MNSANEQDQFRLFLEKFTTLLRDMELDLLAHQAVLGAMNPNIPELLARLEVAKRHPLIQKTLREKYDIPLEEFRKAALQVGVWKALDAMLEALVKGSKSN